MTFEISPYGANHILIQFEQIVDLSVNAQVHAMKIALDQSAWKGVVQVIPAYCSVMVEFDPKMVKQADLLRKIQKLSVDPEEEEQSLLYRIPVCYDGDFAMDMEEVNHITSLSKEDIIAQHCQSIYHTFMIGFLPGFPYLGKLEESLQVPRRSKARTMVPRGSVGLAGSQTGVYPSDAPGGWQIIGRTPIPMFDRHWDKPALLGEGDRVQFFSINSHDFHLIEKDIASGQFNYKSLHVW
ncbi:5-oxoprolinase subunit PxpB [Reichenbachiella ulvae]|uniref:5-oxoprolinase subunit PxpB n=1 Tax=Reichenbachiella ulvae TaxID=2980104 RepID=A0ABT3CU50_9BACT|nr:5-oxoprolinase subunit PxpB [Reichenbachiella ulvae]MCV9387230.1 5-oxoprolinase subunit PxpB [Reichenbachiella ulvae]